MPPESETASQDAATPEAQDPKPEILNVGPPRNGKIAKLPKELRDLINQLLAEGATGAVVIHKLAEHGVSLNHENVSNWRRGGYQDWVLAQDWLAETNAQRESATVLLDSSDETKFQQGVIQLAVTQIFQALKKGNLNQDPSNYTRLLNALSRLAREVLVMKKYRDYCAREQALELKRLDPNRELSDKDHQLFYGKVEELFRLRPGTLAAAAATQQPRTPPPPDETPG